MNSAKIEKDLMGKRRFCAPSLFWDAPRIGAQFFRKVPLHSAIKELRKDDGALRPVYGHHGIWKPQESSKVGNASKGVLCLVTLLGLL